MIHKISSAVSCSTLKADREKEKVIQATSAEMERQKRAVWFDMTMQERSYSYSDSFIQTEAVTKK